MKLARGRGVLALPWLAGLALLLITGSLASPLLPLVALGIVLTSTRTGTAAAGFVGAALLLLSAGGQVRVADLTAAHVVGAVATLLAGVVPALLLERGRRSGRTWTGPRPGGLTGPGRESGTTPDGQRRIADLERALAESCHRTGAVRAILWEVDPDGARAVQSAASDRRLRADPFLLAGTTLGWVWSEGLALWLDREAWLHAEHRARCVRLQRGEGRGALLTWAFDRDRPAPHGGVLEDAAGQLERALALADARAAAGAEQRRSAQLMGVLQRLPSRIDPDEVANELVSAGLDMIPATGAALALWTGETGEVVAVGGADAGPGPGARFQAASSEFALAARGGATILREYGLRGPALPIVAPGEQWRARPRNLAAIPLVTGDRTVAVLGVWSSEQPRLDPAAVSLIETLAPFAALQIEHALEFGRVRARANSDPLTALPNRRAFEDAFRAETARQQRYGHPIGLIVLDVDHFKSINDRFGHEAGDHVLRAVADVLRGAVRELDLPARIGGEEFVVLLPETSVVHAREVADRLRQSIETMTVVWKGEALPVRASLGVSSCPGCVVLSGELMESADAALYEAKRSGRNRVVTAPLRG